MINKSNILPFLSGVALWFVSKTIVMVIHICTQYPVFLIQSIGILKKETKYGSSIHRKEKCTNIYFTLSTSTLSNYLSNLLEKFSFGENTFLKSHYRDLCDEFQKNFCDFRSLWRNCDIDKASSWSVAG